MKNNIIIFVLLCLGLGANSQTFNGYANISSSTLIADSTYYMTLSGFNGGYQMYPEDNYMVTDLAVVPTGAVVWAGCVRFTVDSVITTTPFKLRVKDTENSGALGGFDLLGYRVAIGIETANGFSFSVADGNAGQQVGVSPADAACIWNYYNQISAASGIDSTTYSNDSAFIWSSGQDYFSGITDAPRPNNGRIWYVAKNNPNCSTGAVVGDPTRPFCNPWQAMDSVIAGDVVEVFPAIYKIGDPGESGMDFNITETIGSNPYGVAASGNLYGDMTWYFHNGAIIEGYTSSNTVYLFYGTKTYGGSLPYNDLYDCTVDGFLEVRQNNPNPDSIRISITGDFSVFSGKRPFGKFTFRAKKLLVENFIGRESGAKTQELIIDVGRVENTGRLFTCDSLLNGSSIKVGHWKILKPSSGGNIIGLGQSIKTNIDISLDYLELTGAMGSGQQTPFEWSKSADGTTYNIYVGNIIIDQAATFNQAIASKLVDNQTSGSMVNTLINFRIGNIYDYSSDTLALFGSNSSNYDSTFLNFVIDNIYTKKGGVLKFADSDTDLSKWTFKVENCFQDNSRNVAMFSSGGSNAGNYFVDGNFENKGQLASANSNYADRIYLSGRHKTSGTIAVSSDSNINLHNLICVTAAGTPFQNKTLSVTFNCINVASNQTAIDADVTEAVQPIVRHSSVK